MHAVIPFPGPSGVDCLDVGCWCTVRLSCLFTFSVLVQQPNSCGCIPRVFNFVDFTCSALRLLEFEILPKCNNPAQTNAETLIIDHAFFSWK